MSTFEIQQHKLSYEQHYAQVRREFQESKAIQAAIVSNFRHMFAQIRHQMTVWQQPPQLQKDGAKPQWTHW